jgi:hypothetical protein
MPAHHLLNPSSFRVLDQPLSDGVAIVIAGFMGWLLGEPAKGPALLQQGVGYAIGEFVR